MRTICLTLAAVVLCAGNALAEFAIHESEHLAIQYDPEIVSATEVRMAEERGERYRAAIADLLGHEPPQRIAVILHGPAEQPDGSWATPRVDGFGRVHLYRFTDEPESFFGAYAHELVHVFRVHRRPYHDRFTEEGFAEFIARRVDERMHGFPWYGYSMDLVAGQFVAADEDIALADLRARHQELNMPCRLQSYALRASFFDWLGQSFGDDAVLEFAAAEKAGAFENYQTIFGADFAALSARWRSELLTRFEAISEHAARAEAYRTTSPAQYIPVCDPAR